MRLLLALAVLFTPAVLMSQTIMESAILSGSVAAGASGPAAATGSAMSKALGTVDASLSKAAGSSVSAPPRTYHTIGTPPLPKPAQAAFQGIEPGTTRTELIAKAGNPQFAIASTDGEILRYATSEGGSIRIRIVEGKVESIEQAPPKSAPTTPVPSPPADPAK